MPLRTPDLPLATPLVSVIIPAYNAGELLTAAIDSVLIQTYENLEVWIVDDGSTDNTSEVAADFARRFPWIRVLTQPNAGVGAARNLGIAAATGAYIAPLDADDIWFPDKIRRQVDCLERGGERVGFCYCWSKAVAPDGEVRQPIWHWPVRGRAFQSLIYRNFVGNASVPMFRATVLREVGGYLTRDEQGGGQGCEDWDITLRIAAKHFVEEVPEYLSGYRLAMSTMTSDISSMAKSYEHLIASLRTRHRDLPEALYHWSAGHFYLYLLNISYAAADYPACWNLLRKLLRADRAALLSPTLYRILVMTMIRTITGPDFLRRKTDEAPLDDGRPTPLIWRPSHRIEARRWAAVQEWDRK